MMMIFPRTLKFLVANRVPTGQSVNQWYYRQLLMTNLRPTIRKKQGELLEASPCILHDNAAAHVAGNIASLIASYNWEVLPHSRILLISPPDYDLFPTLKEPLPRIKFDLDVLGKEVASQVRHMNIRSLATGVVMLPERWKSVIEHKGYYIEGL